MKPWAKLLIYRGCRRCGVHWPIWTTGPYQMNELQPAEILNKALISKHSLKFVDQIAISENSSQKTNPTNKTPTPFSLKHDLFISQNVCQLKSCQPDPNLSYSPILWSSLQKPFLPQAMISSDLTSETGPGLSRTAGDTSEGTPDASGSSWWWHYM